VADFKAAKLGRLVTALLVPGVVQNGREHIEEARTALLASDAASAVARARGA